ncbi:hypothetical protein [Mangrovicoccus ximenensis]|uniref:hypothetical protein n=1 Tax=Mangrovicoccus ximenensis TaxID=1911570 RepID=UPI000D3AD3BD|nr:hypothetical protein [Mangrovicoccus ximenensis]
MKLLVATAAALAAAGMAAAAPITFEWTGRVNSVSAQRGDNLDIGLQLQDRVTGSFAYDIAHPDARPADPDSYFAADMPMWITAIARGHAFSFAAAESTAQVAGIGGGIFQVDNSRDTAPTGSLFGATALDNDADANAGGFLASDPWNPAVEPILLDGSELNAGVASFNVQISAPATGLFGADALLNESLDLDDFAQAFMNFGFTEDPNGLNALQFTVALDSFRLEGDPLPPVPLPPAAAALAEGRAWQTDGRPRRPACGGYRRLLDARKASAAMSRNGDFPEFKLVRRDGPWRAPPDRRRTRWSAAPRSGHARRRKPRCSNASHLLQPAAPPLRHRRPSPCAGQDRHGGQDGRILNIGPVREPGTRSVPCLRRHGPSLTAADGLRHRDL